LPNSLTIAVGGIVILGVVQLLNVIFPFILRMRDKGAVVVSPLGTSSGEQSIQFWEQRIEATVEAASRKVIESTIVPILRQQTESTVESASQRVLDRTIVPILRQQTEILKEQADILRSIFNMTRSAEIWAEAARAKQGGGD
jgi:hypothetical protein